jgi:sugar lactone lactonase YvrE
MFRHPPHSPSGTAGAPYGPRLGRYGLAGAGLSLALTLACSGSGGSSPAPTIASFTAAPPVITQGDTASLTAVFPSGSGSVSPGVGSVVSGAAVSVTPAADTTYVLTVTSAGGRKVSKSVTVPVSAPVVQPVINAASLVLPNQPCVAAVTQPQADCTYTWQLNGQDAGTVAPGTAAVSFTAPAADGGNTLTCYATNLAGAKSAVASFSFNVQASQTISAYTATPGIITAGGGASLAAAFTGNTGLITPGNVGMASTRSMAVTPTIGTVYGLQVDGAGPQYQNLVHVVRPVRAGSVRADANVAPNQDNLSASVPAQPGCAYAWTLGGDGSITSDPGRRAITYQVGAPGAVTLTCRITNAAGAVRDQIPATVTVGPTISGFSAAPASIAPGGSATLNFWFDGGNGVVQAGNSATPVTSGGTLAVSPAQTTEYTLVVTDDGNRQATAKALVQVNAPGAPVISSFTAAQTTLAQGDSTTLLAQFSGTSAIIDAGVGAVASNQAVTVAPTADTTYTLTVNGASGTTPATRAVTVHVVPPSGISASALVEAGHAGYTASVPQQDGATYLWNILNGAITAGGNSPVVTFTAGEIGQLQLFCIITSGGNASVLTLPVTVTPPGNLETLNLVATPANISAGQAGCTAEAPETGLRYAWSIDSESTSVNATFTSPTDQRVVTFTAGGQGELVLYCSASDDQGNVLAWGVLTVPVTGPAISDFSASNLKFTVGDTVTLNFAFTGGTGVLTPGNQVVASGGSFQVTPGQSQNYKLTVTDPGGVSVSRNLSLVGYPAPAIDFFTANRDIVSPGSTVQLAGQFDPGPGGSASVDQGMGAFASNTAVTTGALTGRTTYTLTVTNGAGAHAVAQALVRVATLTQVGGSVSGPGYLDGQGTAAVFNGPSGAVFDSIGNMYVADTGNSLIRKISVSGLVTTYAGQPGRSGWLDGRADLALFNAPAALAIDDLDNLYVADRGNYVVRKITPGSMVSTVAGVPGVPGTNPGPYDSDPLAPSPEARLSNLQGIAVTRLNNAVIVYVAETTATGAMIRSFTPTGQTSTVAVNTVAGNANASGNFDGPSPIQSLLQQPNGLALTEDGNTLFISDRANGNVRMLDGLNTAAPTLTTLAAGIAGASGVAIDNGGGASYAHVLVASQYANVIWMLTPGAPWQGGIVAGTAAEAGHADGTGDAALFDQPAGLTANAGNLYVMELGNNDVRELTTDLGGMVGTIAGGPSQAGSTNGPLAQARFNNPWGMAQDNLGNLYLADAGNFLIRDYDGATSLVTTLAGIAGQQGNTDIPALFLGPKGIAWDAQSGNLFVADTTDAGNGELRRVTPGLGLTQTVFASGGAFGNLNAVAVLVADAGKLQVGAAGHSVVLVSDPAHHVVWWLDPSAATVTPAVYAGTLTHLDHTTEGFGALAYPAGLALAEDGTLFIADRDANAIMAVTPGAALAARTMSVLAGSPSQAPGWVDATGQTARFNQPFGLALDSTGSLFVTELGQGSLRLVTPHRGVSTVAGTLGLTGFQPAILPGSLQPCQGILAVADGSAVYLSTPNGILKLAFQP